MRQVRRPIFHLHIPKTGGQTFGGRLAAAWPAERVYYLQGDLNAGRDEARLTEMARTHDLISCHVNGPLLAGEGRFDIVTLVRHPIDQIISNYRHVRRGQSILKEFVNSVRFDRALDLVPEIFFNMQSRYLVRAFHRRTPREYATVDERVVLHNLGAACESVRWMGTTDEMEHFLIAFCAEADVPVVVDSPSINEAPAEDADLVAEMRAWLAADPDRFAIDLALYREAKRRASELRSRAVSNILSRTTEGSTALRACGRALREDGRLIQLLSGWWPVRHVDGWGVEHRAGPGRVSRIAYERRHDDHLLECDVAFVAGITLKELKVIDMRRGVILPHVYQTVGSFQRLTIDMSATEACGELAFCVPRVFPLSMFSGGYGREDQLISMSLGRWRFASRQIELPHAGT